MQFFLKKKQKCKIYLSKETTTVCFQHGMVYGDFKSLPRRITCDKVLRDKAFNIVKNPICNGNQKGIASKIYKFFDKRSSENSV